MKIKRFVAKDIRLTMRMVKEELGADAVIMSNRSVDEGVEIIAAKDFDEKVFHKQLNAQIKPTVTNKRIELADFEAEKNNIHLVRSPRKKDTEENKPKQALHRPHRPIDHYVGYAEKIHLASEKNKVSTKNQATGHSTSSNVEKQRVFKDKENINQQVIINNAFMQEMRKEITSLKSTLDTRLSELSLNPGFRTIQYELIYCTVLLKWASQKN